MKVQLPTVTLCIVDCINAKRAMNVIDHCASLCDFGGIKLLTHIPCDSPYKVKIKPLNTLIAYSIFMLKKCHEFIDTEKVLIVQRDGFIINPSSWDDSFLRYDYIAPLFVQYPKVGSGGFSLRSKKIMEEISKTVPDWDWTQKEADRIQSGLDMYEDGVISLSPFGKNFNIAPPEEAGKFCQGGNSDPRYYYPHPFGFHGVLNNIDHRTGLVSPVCEHGGGYCECVKPHVDYLFKMEQ